jgi:hypothetical protein
MIRRFGPPISKGCGVDSGCTRNSLESDEFATGIPVTVPRGEDEFHLLLAERFNDRIVSAS